jgi:hypothetical protein
VLSQNELTVYFQVIYSIAAVLLASSMEEGSNGVAALPSPALLAHATALNALEDCGTAAGLSLDDFIMWTQSK